MGTCYILSIFDGMVILTQQMPYAKYVMLMLNPSIYHWRHVRVLASPANRKNVSIYRKLPFSLQHNQIVFLLLNRIFLSPSIARFFLSYLWSIYFFLLIIVWSLSVQWFGSCFSSSGTVLLFLYIVFFGYSWKNDLLHLRLSRCVIDILIQFVVFFPLNFPLVWTNFF